MGTPDCTLLDAVSHAISVFNYTARLDGETVAVYTRKGQLAGTISPEGKISQKMDGYRHLLGCFVKDAITKAIPHA